MPSRAARFKASVVRVVCLALVFLAVGRVGGHLRIAARLRALLGQMLARLAHSRSHPSDLIAGAAGALGQAAVIHAHRRRRRNRPRRDWTYAQLPDV